MCITANNIHKLNHQIWAADWSSESRGYVAGVAGSGQARRHITHPFFKPGITDVRGHHEPLNVFSDEAEPRCSEALGTRWARPRVQTSSEKCAYSGSARPVDSCGSLSSDNTAPGIVSGHSPGETKTKRPTSKAPFTGRVYSSVQGGKPHPVKQPSSVASMGSNRLSAERRAHAAGAIADSAVSRISHLLEERHQAAHSFVPEPTAEASCVSPTAESAFSTLLECMHAKHLNVISVFRSFDTDCSGSLDAMELKQALWRLGVRLSLAQWQSILKVIDSDDSGFVDYSEFMEMLKEYRRGGWRYIEWMQKNRRSKWKDQATRVQQGSTKVGGRSSDARLRRTECAFVGSRPDLNSAANGL